MHPPGGALSHPRRTGLTPRRRGPGGSPPHPGEPDAIGTPADLAALAGQFIDLWTRGGPGETPWPAFDQFVRDRLQDLFEARRVRLFHVVEGGQALRPLTSGAANPAPLTAPTALMRHVISVGRRYLRGDWSHGPLIDELAADSETPPPIPAGAPAGGTPAREPAPACGPVAWMFPIRDPEVGIPGQENDGVRSIGLVVAADLPEPALADRDRLNAAADLITEFWLHLRDYESLQIVRRTDRGSGVLNRADFLTLAETVVADARREGEPIALMAVALEGLRRFDDRGLWSLRDRVVHDTGLTLRRRLRGNDLVGRFSDDRFVILLRWVDLSLGRLIADKVIDWVHDAVAEATRKHAADEPPDAGPLDEAAAAAVRCGLACDYRVDVARPGETLDWDGPPASPPRPPATFRELLTAALAASAEARRRRQRVCVTDLAAGTRENTP